jgi:hypothetical protein
MVLDEYLLVKGATPIAVNFPVEISGLTEACLHRQSRGIITETAHQFQQKKCSIYFIKLLGLDDIIHNMMVSGERQAESEKGCYLILLSLGFVA